MNHENILFVLDQMVFTNVFLINGGNGLNFVQLVEGIEWYSDWFSEIPELW